MGQDVEKLDLLCIAGGNIKDADAVENCTPVPQTKLNIELLYDPTIPLLRKYPKELKAETQTDISTPMFTMALITVAKRWKPALCLSVDE